MKLSARLILFEALAFLVVALLAGTGFVAWRLSQGPIDLELIRPQVERSLTEARAGQPVTIDGLALEWAPGRGRVEAAARGLAAMDTDGDMVFRADRAVISLDALSLLGGKFKTRRLRLEAGRATVTRSADGVWTSADIVLLREPKASDKPFDPLKDLDWATLATPIRALVSAGSFERVEFENFNLTVNDLKTNTRWGANPVNGVWSAGDDGVTLDLDLKLVGAGEPNRVGLALAANGDVSRATGRLVLQGVDPVSIARMFGYMGDGFSSGMPANASFTVSATEAGGLDSAQFTLSDVTGRATIGDRDIAVAGLSLDAAYDPATRSIDVRSLSMASDVLTGRFKGSADVAALMAGDAEAAIPFTLEGENFTVDVRPVFAEAWPFERARIEGEFKPSEPRLSIAALNARSGELDAMAQGDVWIGTAPDETRRIGLKLTALGQGVATPQQVAAFWPVDIGSGGRDWVRTNILAGRATRADFTVDWPPGANAAGYLPDEHLTLEFDIEGASVKFLEDFPPVTDVVGKGLLRGNSLTIDVTAGRMGGWRADEGKVVLPQFHPKGEMLEVTASAQGELREIMRVLDASNLKVGSEYGLAVNEMTGRGGISVTVRRPMLDHVPDEALQYAISGGFREASAPNLVSGFGLSSSDVRVEVTQEGLSVTGAGRFGPAAVVFDWKERFGETGGVDLTASAKATPDLLNAFGLAARNFMQGEADVELRASGPGGRDFSEITANVDFTRSQLEIPVVGWRKRFDSPARGSVRYGVNPGGAILTGDIRADGLELIGDMTMNEAGDVVSAGIERLFSRGAVDLRGGVTRREDGSYRLALMGPYFDASPWMDSIMSTTDQPPPAPPLDGPAGGPAPTFGVSLNADRLKLREDAELRSAKVAFELDDRGPRTGSVSGQISEGKTAEVSISPQGEARRVTIRSDDAGFAARVLLKLDYLHGGKLTLDGVFGAGSSDAQVTMTDVRLKDAPLVAQILSLASLRGLADVLGGDGVLFTSVDAPIRLSKGRIDLPGLRASGPAMGLTARGWIAPDAGELSLDGVLVPSFGVNSALGGLPIIGDLFVSRQGEGMFAPTYSVRGTFERARVAINPLAAVTPGVLRRIFENPSEPPPAEAVAPPAPPPAPN